MSHNPAGSDARGRNKATSRLTSADGGQDPRAPSPVDPPAVGQHRAAAERFAGDLLAAIGMAPRPHSAASSPDRPLPDRQPPIRPPIGNVVRLSEVAPEPVQWLSPGRLGIGKVTVLDGDPGTGKSTLLCDFAARVTRGRPLPGGQPAAPRGVILLAAEDGLFDTIRPRIDAAGGDPRRVVTLVSVPGRAQSTRPVALPGDAATLGALALHADASLVIIDPLAGFLGPRHSVNDTGHMRHVLDTLREVAELANIAIVVVRHLNKAAGGNPMYRGGGSIDIIGSARCGLLLARDPDDPDRRILAATKENLTAPPPSLAFRLATELGSGAARVVWEGESRWTATQLLHAAAETASGRSALTEARLWLRAALAAGPRPSKALQQEAAAHGHAERTLVRARRAEHIVVRKEPGRNGRWTWELPPAPTASSPTRASGAG